MPNLPNVSPDILKAYQEEIARRASPATLKRKNAALSKFFDWAQTQGHVPQNPLAQVQVITSEPVVQKPTRNNHRLFVNIFRVGILGALVIIIFFLLKNLKLPIPFIKTPAQEAATAVSTPTQPVAILSPWTIYAKLNLKDTKGTPVSASQTITFKLYRNQSDTAPVWTSETKQVTPDTDGTITTSLDSVPTDTFFENERLYLGGTAQSGNTTTRELPRIPVSTANTASNLQGFTPASPATANTIPVISENGSLLLAGESPSIQATEGNLSFSGQAVTVMTPTASGGNITLAPGGGDVNVMADIHIQNANLTSGALLNGIVANNANGTGYYLLKLQSGTTPTTKFSVDGAGNTYIGGNLTFGSNLNLVSGDLQINGVTRLNHLGRLSSITGYYQDSGIFKIDQGGPDYAEISKVATTVTGAASANVLNLTLNESALTSGSGADTLVIKRQGGTADALALLVDEGNARFDGQVQLGQYSTNPTAIGPGTVIYNSSDDKVYVWDGSQWQQVATGALTFNNLSSGTNTSATMTVGSGATLTYSGTGIINATQLLGSTWNAPGTIGATTPNTGAFTTLSASGATTFNTIPYTWPGTEVASGFLQTNGTGQLSWTTSLPSGTTVSFDKITSGTNIAAAMVVDTGASLNYSHSGTINASSLTGATWAAPAAIGSTTPNSGTFTTVNATTGVNTGAAAGTERIDATGNLTNIGNITASGTINFSTLSASKAVFTDGSKNLSSSGTVGPDQGGTGFSTYAVGDLLYADTTSTLAKLPDVATGNVLISGGLNTAPKWDKVTLGTHTTGNYVASLAGTPNQITASGATGSVTLSIPTDFRAPGTVNAVSGLYTGATAGTQRIDATGNLVNIGNIDGSGAITVTPAGGSNLNITLTTTGDFAVSSNQLYVDTSEGKVGIGTASPAEKLDVQGSILSSALTGTGNRCVYADSFGILHVKSGDCGLATSTGDDLGSHIATQNIELNNYWLSNDGGSEGIRVDNSGNVGVGTAGPDARLDSLATTEQLRLTYTDNTTYTSFTVNNSGDLTIAPTGGDVAITGDLAVNGATSADILSTTDTATIFNTTVTSLSLGGAATTLNVGTTNGVTRAINIGTGDGADTIHIGDGATGADTITIGGGVGTLAINTGDWDINATGDATGIGGITMDGNFSQTGAGTFGTGTGAISLNGDTTLAANKNLTLTSGTGTITQNYANTTGTSTTINHTNSGASGTNDSKVLSLAITGTDNATGTNTISALNIPNITAHTNNTYYGLVAGTGLTDILRYNGTQIISGLGVLQSAGLSGTYSNALTLSSTSNAFTGTIGQATPLAGAFTTLTSNGNSTIGTGASLTNTFGSGASSINTIGSTTTPGALTLHGATTLDNTFSQTGANTFGTGTGAVSLNGDTTIAADKSLTFTAGTGSITANSTVTNASKNVIDVVPTYAGGATDSLTYTGFNLAAFTPTNAAGTDLVNGMEIGALTDPGATITSTALKIGAGWDNVLTVNGTVVINGSGQVVAGGISGTLLNTSSDSGSSTLIQGDTLAINGGTNGIDTVLSGDTYTVNLDTTEIGDTTFGSGSSLTWTFDASAGTDTTVAFGDNLITLTAATTTLSGDLKLTGADILDTNGNEFIRFTATPAAVDELTVANAAADGVVTLAATGGDDNIALSIDAKGSDALNLNNTGTGDIVIGGGSGSTGCTITNSSGNLVCSGTITGTGGVTASSMPFSGITGATNTTAAMVVGTGASLTYHDGVATSGEINASLLENKTWAAPGTIGSGTPNSGAFTTLSSTGITALGNDSATVAIDSSDWNINVTGDATGIGGITMDGNFSQTGAGTFGTATGAISLNGDTTLAANKNITTTAGTGALILNSTVSNASKQVIDIAPSYAGGATDSLTYTIMDIAAFAPTNAAGTDFVNGMEIGALTDPGATITSTALKIGAGWDNVLTVNGTVIIDGTGHLAAGQISGTILNTSADSGTGTLDIGDTLAINGGTNGIDTSLSGDTYTLNFDATEVGSVTWGAASAITWTFDASGGTDPTIAFGDNAITETATTRTFTNTTTLTASSLATITSAATLSFSGDIKVTGNDIQDSGGASAITFDGSQNTQMNGNLTVAAGKNITTTAGTGNLALNSTVSNASKNIIDITPSYAGGANNSLTYTGINLAAFAPTNASGTDTVNGMEMGALTDPGATITSTALKIGTGWDNVLTVNGTVVINGSGQVAVGQITGTIFNSSADSGTSTLVVGDTLAINGGTNGIDTSLSGDTYTLNFDATEVGSVTWGAASAITWTFDASGGTDPTIAFGDNTATITAATTTLSGNLVVQGTTGLTFNTGAGGDITFAYGEKIDNDTDGTLNLTATTLGLTNTTTITASSLATITSAATLSFSGDIKVTGNNIQDSGGATAITFDGSENTQIDGNLTVAANKNITTTAGTGALVLNSTVSNASKQVIDIAPSYAGGAGNPLTYTIMDIAAFAPTNAAGTDVVNGIEMGALTDPGATITSTALKIGTGWDNVLTVNGTVVIDSTGQVPVAQITGTLLDTSSDSGTGTLVVGDTLAINGGTGMDTSLSGDTYTIAFDSTEIGNTTWGSGSATTWTFNASAGTDTTIAFGDNTQTFTTGTGTFSGNLVVQGTTGLTFNTGAGGDITFAYGEKIDNDTDGTLQMTATTTAVSGDLKLTGADILDTNGNEFLRFTSTASAVDEVTIANAAANGVVTLAATGGDTDIALSIDSKGADALNLNGTATGDILIGGGSGSTGCTITNSTGALACSGTISGTIPWSELDDPTAALSLTMGAGEETTFTEQSTTQTGFTWTSSTLTSGMLGKFSLTGSSAVATAANSGSLLTLSSATTGFTGATQTLANVYSSGANANAGVTVRGISSTVANTNGTSGTNIAAYLSASGATTANYALIAAAGSVGIGNTAPASPLEVNGEIRSDRAGVPAQYITLDGGDSASKFMGGVSPENNQKPLRISNSFTSTGSPLGNSNIYFQTGLLASESVRMTILDTGNVGINTTGPDSPLDVLSTGGTQLRLTYTDGSVSTTFNTASTGDLTVDMSGGQLILADADTLNVGGLTNVAYNAFANAADTPAVTGSISTDNDLFVGGDFELKGNLYLTGKSIYNVVGSTGTGTITFAADPNAQGKYNILTNGSWMVDNTTGTASNNLAALIVNQDNAEDIFAASASGSPMFTITSGGDVGIGTTTPSQKLAVSGGNELVWDDSSLGNELLTNTTFDSNTTSWTAVNATLASVAGGESGNALRVTNVATYGSAVQAITTIPGTRYQLYVYFLKGTDASGIAWVGTTSGGGDLLQATLTDAAWTLHTYYFTATTTTTYLRLGNGHATNAQTSFFDEVSIKEVTGGNIALSGQLLGYGGTSGIKITGAGNVGIGTTVANSALTVGGVGIASYAMYATGTSAIYGDATSGTGVYGYTAGGGTAAGIYGEADTGVGGYFNSTSGYALITGAGNVGVGMSTPGAALEVYDNNATNYAAIFKNDGNNANRYGMDIWSGADNAAGTNVAVNIADGDGTSQGQITFSGGTVTYGAFTANHNVSIPEEFNASGYPYGTLLCIISTSTDASAVRNIMYQTKACDDGPYSRNVLGAYAGKYDNEPNLHQVYVLGDGQILVNGEGGDIKTGDFLTTSSTVGIGMKATASGMTIGVAQEDYHFESPTEVKLLNVQYGLHDYMGTLNIAGNLNLEKVAENVGGSAKYQLSENGAVLDKIGAFASVVSAEVKAGLATLSELIADNITVNQKLISPVVETNLITPLAGTDTVIVDAPKVEIKGDLKVEDVEAQNATISGELYAEKINSPDLDKIQEVLRQVQTDQSLLSQVSTWNTNTNTATPSGEMTNLTVNSLFVTDQAAVNSLSLANSLTLGTDMVIQGLGKEGSDNSLNTLSSPLKLQSLALAPVEIMAGKFRIETNGDVVITGNLFIAGTIESQGITIKDTTGTETANINASGAAEFKKVSTDSLIIAGAEATSSAALADGNIQTNATAGAATIPAGTSEITIENLNVTDYTLIYLTPTSATDNQVLYLKSKGAGRFVAGFTSPLSTAVTFNWWVIGVSQ